MRIVRLTAHHVRIPLKRTIRHASHSRDDTDSLVVRCELTDGSVGWGEGLPREYVTGETIGEAWGLLQQPDVVEQLSEPIDDIPAAITRLERLLLPEMDESESSDLRFEISDFKSEISNLEPQISNLELPIHADRSAQLEPFLQRGCFGNSVRCAIELAVLDAVCRHEGTPLSHVTELVAETEQIRQQAQVVRYSGVITGENARSQLHSALKQRVYGLRALKVKVGIVGHNDAASLRRIRRIVGSRVDLRIDANEAWCCDTLLEMLDPLLPSRITAVEQPVPHADVGGLASMKDQLKVPIMLDESLCCLTDARRAIDERLCDLFNIRLSKCGGFLPSLRLAAIAHAAGLGYQLGCQVGETGILSAAGRHFATSVAGIRYFEGSYDRHLVRERLTVEDVTFGYGGRAPALKGPGLGVTVDEGAVRRVTRRQYDLI